jgi:cyclic pyranopterin monophosphate synthase
MGMIDVGGKPDSLRIAVAQALLSFDINIMSTIKDGNSPKGNIFEIAKVAGTLGAKKTSDLIPYCHPIPIDDVKVEVMIETGRVRIIVKVKSIWKTGVEMEALTGATIAALSVYDILKPLDISLSIDNIKLLEKHGGIGDFREKYTNKLEATVITISDSRKKDQDESGKLIINALTRNGFSIVAYKVIPDDIKIIEKELIYYSDELKVNIIITTGGTGVGPHDVTPEATKGILEKEVLGISENLRDYGQSRTPLSMLSRGVSGIRGNTLIVNMPGSTNAVSQSINALFPGVMHIFSMIAGQGHHK